MQLAGGAGRDAETRRLAAGFWSGTRELAAEQIGRLYAEASRRPLVEPSEIATAIIALDVGLALQRYVDPDAVSPDTFPRLYDLLLPLRRTEEVTRCSAGPFSPAPTCTVDGTQVTCPATAFQLAGVGNANATEQVTATYSQTIDCRNNGGQVVESHQTTGTASSPSVPLTSSKNGRLEVTPVPVDVPSGGFTPQASCPNPNWTPEPHGNPTLTGFTYTLKFAGFNQPAITITGP